MKKKPCVCVIDDDPHVGKGWKYSLGNDAHLYYFQDHLKLFEKAKEDPTLIPSFNCVIMGRYFKPFALDVVNSDVAEKIKEEGSGPVFLNWQGYIVKEDLAARFDGKLFHRYGVKWQTLRLRIQKYERSQKFQKKAPAAVEVQTILADVPTVQVERVSKPLRCQEVLQAMARRAQGTHRERIEFYVTQDQGSGVELLEAIYDRLVTNKNRPDTCPSRYINSSPIIAKRILHDALYGS
jgi:hypothetical protein